MGYTDYGYAYDCMGFSEYLWFLVPLFYGLILGLVILKFIALWYAARNNQLTWFIVLALLGTAGILDLLYLLCFRPKDESKQKKVTKVKDQGSKEADTVEEVETVEETE